MLIMDLKNKDGYLFVSLLGKLTKKEVYKIEYHLIPYIKHNHLNKIIFNCQKLSKIDYDGKYALLKLKVMLHKSRGKMLLCDVKEDIKKSLINYRMKVRV